MALPPLPNVGANWTPWGTAVHDGVNGAAVVADIATPGTATGDAFRAASDARYAPRGNPAQGAIVLFLDDLILGQYQNAVPYVESVGGKVTIAAWTAKLNTTGYMTSAQVLDLYRRGHEIAPHSVSHNNMTIQTVAQRTVEFDNSRAAVEAIIGSGNAGAYVYPFNANNLTTDIEAYLRYSRVFAGPAASFVRPIHSRSGLVNGRMGWFTSTHPATLEMLRAMAHSNNVVSLYTHSVDGSDGSQGVTWAQFTELVDVATALGYTFVTASRGLGGNHPIPDAGFENPTLADNWVPTLLGAGAAASVVDAPMTGLVGSRSLRITNDNLTAGNQSVLARFGIPLAHPMEPYTFSCRFRQDKTAGTGGAAITVSQYNDYSALLTTATSAYEFSSQPWKQVSVAFTPHAQCRSVKVGFIQQQLEGASYFDHLHLGPTRDGVYG